MLSISKAVDFLKENPNSSWNHIASMLFRLGRVKIKGSKNNTIRLKNTYARNLKIVIEGVGNVIDFDLGGANYIKNSIIYIHGNNNRIVIGKRNYIECADLYIEDDDNLISFGNHNRVFGKTHVACIEGTSVTFKDGCLFSANVVFRTGDSHSILDANTSRRINPSKSIEVGNRVWFGNTTTILKGIKIGDDSIIGTGSIVTSDVPSNTIVAGVPAKVIKSGVKWGLTRTKIVEDKKE